MTEPTSAKDDATPSSPQPTAAAAKTTETESPVVKPEANKPTTQDTPDSSMIDAASTFGSGSVANGADAGSQYGAQRQVEPCFEFQRTGQCNRAICKFSHDAELCKESDAKKVCFEFVNKGTCTYPSCKYQHVAPNETDSIVKKNNRPCYEFMRKGTCTIGSACRFRHEASANTDLMGASAGVYQPPPPPLGGGLGEGKVCFEYTNRGTCKYGAGCTFRHDSAGARQRVCFKFVNKGECQFGENCRFAHVRDSSLKLCLDYVNKGSCNRPTCMFQHIEPHAKRQEKGNSEPLYDLTGKTLMPTSGGAEGWPGMPGMGGMDPSSYDPTGAAQLGMWGNPAAQGAQQGAEAWSRGYREGFQAAYGAYGAAAFTMGSQQPYGAAAASAYTATPAAAGMSALGATSSFGTEAAYPSTDTQTKRWAPY